MNVLFRVAAVAVGVSMTSFTLAGAPLLSALQGAPGCAHVLRLLTRYGGLEGLPTPGGLMAMPSPMGGFAMPLAELGDLCVASVEQLPGAGGCAPTIIVGVTNSSTRPVCDVHVSIVALLGPIKPFDPTANVRLAEVPAGATVEVEIVLPVEALAMGSHAGAPVGFQKLLVAVDSLDRFLEVDEVNNLKLLCGADIPVRVIAQTAVEEVPAEVEETTAPEQQPAAENPALDQALEKFGIDLNSAETAAAQL